MFSFELSRAVENFAALLLPLSEKDLEREWIWKDHDEEGIRFAFFVTLQELRHLAVTLSTLRPAPTSAQRILGQYHASFIDLQAALFGLPSEDAERAPAEGEWSIRKIYAHILRAEINFTATVRYALEKHRAGTWTPQGMSDEDAIRLIGMSETEHGALLTGPLEGMLAYHRAFHPEILKEFSTITDSELDLPSTFWEETRFPIHHRLHRFDAHLTQHTVQVDKALVEIGRAPSEAKRLIRKIYAALAEAEAMMIGTEKMDDAAILGAASSIAKRTNEIKQMLT
jgi:hypothetical protein